MEAVKQRPKNNIQYLITGLVGVFLLSLLAAAYLPSGIDWHQAFYPAGRAMLRGESPYAAADEFNMPFWALVPLMPFTLFDEAVGRGFLFVIALCALCYVVYRFGASPASMVLFLLSPPVIALLMAGNIDWLVLLGVLMPPQVGLFFVLIKPQIGAVIALWWLVEHLREKQWRKFAVIFTPITIAVLLQLGLFGLTPLRGAKNLDHNFNISLWPWTIPVGVLLLYISIRKRTIKPAMAAGPLLSPYALIHSWSIVLVPLVSNIKLMAAAFGLAWGIILLTIIMG